MVSYNRLKAVSFLEFLKYLQKRYINYIKNKLCKCCKKTKTYCKKSTFLGYIKYVNTHPILENIAQLKRFLGQTKLHEIN